MGYKRGLRNTYCHTSLVKIQGCDTQKDVDFYLGKRIAYIYKVRQRNLPPFHRCGAFPTSRPHQPSEFVSSPSAVVSGADGEEGQQVPCDLGQGHAGTRQQRCCADEVP